LKNWYSIKKGTTLPICYYGYRIPFLGFFPNIISLNNDLTNSNNNYVNSKNNSSNNILIAALTTAK